MRVEHGQKLQGVRHDYYSMDLYLMLVLQNNNTAVEPIHMRTILNRIREDNIFLSGLTMGQETERNEAASNVAFSKLSEHRIIANGYAHSAHSLYVALFVPAAFLRAESFRAR